MPAGAGVIVVVQVQVKVAPTSPVMVQIGAVSKDWYVVVDTVGAAGMTRSRVYGVLVTTGALRLPAGSVACTSSR